MANTATPYVRFSRGSILAYNSLTTKNKDTLYFVTDETTSKSKLYLGDELISSEVAKLSDLEDLVISSVGSNQVLVYNETTEKWENKSLAEAIGVYQGATVSTPGKAGLVPAAAASEKDYFLRGDGTWAEITISEQTASTQVFEATPVDEETHIEAIARVATGKTLAKGDIGIVKVLVYGDRYEYTAYVYDGENWKAMDGNYSAENVYFDSDFTFTEKVGTVQTLTNGSATVAAAGKNVKEFLAGLFAAPKNPTVTEPSVSIALSGAGAKEVGSKVTPNYSVTFNKGSYTYGPDTGITATYVVSNSADSDTKTTATGSFNEITIEDNTSYAVTVKATYTDGAVPKNNLGTEVPGLAITGGTKSATSSGRYSGYRNSFYGTVTDKTAAVDSAAIRNLTKSNQAYNNGSTFTINIPVGATRVIFAYPATLRDVTSVLDVNGMNATITEAFTKSSVYVEGANGYESIEYKVYITDFANPVDTANTYKVTI